LPQPPIGTRAARPRWARRLAVVDGTLRVYGIDNLRIADASIMPRITSGNIMAPCVVIGERAAQMLIADDEL
jgi:choline dehydrogenase